MHALGTFVLLVTAFLLLSAATALRPGRKGIFALLAYPVGWAAGELPAQAIVAQVALVAMLWWSGWPRSRWLGVLLVALALAVVALNLGLVAISFYSRVIVRRALATHPWRPLACPRPGEDRFGSWWRTALQISLHPRSMRLTQDVPYGPDERQRLDVWRMPRRAAFGHEGARPKGAPVVFYVHGGAWTMGNKRTEGRPMLHELVARGWVVVACEYRRAPRDPWPAQIEDVTRAFAWLKNNVASYGGDPDRIVVAGCSAGGQLAALLALSARDPTWRPADVAGVKDWSVRGCMSFYGPLEMTGDEAHWHGLGRGLRKLLETRVVLRPLLGNEEIYQRMSPYHRIEEGSPPFLVVQGGNDTLVDVHVARDFVDRFRKVARAPVYYVELPFAQHAFDAVASPRTSATTRAAVAFASSLVGAESEVALAAGRAPEPREERRPRRSRPKTARQPA